MTTRGDVVAFPGLDEIGTTSTWDLPAPGGGVRITGRFLGMSKSWHPGHTDRDKSKIHPGFDFARAGVRCPTCRWFEPRIFREKNDGRFLVYQVGRSVVPGEVDYPRCEWAMQASEVLEILVTRGQEKVYFTRIAARTLSQAAGYDDDLRDAWENRAIP